LLLLYEGSEKKSRKEVFGYSPATPLCVEGWRCCQTKTALFGNISRNLRKLSFKFDDCDCNT
jgi:hypothetical protein